MKVMHLKEVDLLDHIFLIPVALKKICSMTWYESHYKHLIQYHCVLRGNKPGR